MEHADGNDRLYLWNYFATTRFHNDDGREVYPVIILDQFKEVFRDADKRKAEFLLQQIYLLLNDELEMPNQEGYNAETNYRFIASIREDFLFVLEDSIDEYSLDLYKNNRYRLRPMKPENARQVVLIPGKDCIEESEKEAVADKIVLLAKRNEQSDIDTLLLSLVCAGTFDKKAGEKICAADLAIWKSNPMEVYYQDAVKSLSANQVRYIQQHLIREDGSRKRVDAKEVKAALGENTYHALTRGENRMLVLGEHGQVELLHDQLALAVYEERKAFEERERKKRLRRRMSLAGLTIFIIGGIFLFQYQRLKEQRNQLWRTMVGFVTEKANNFVDEGNFYGAQKILLEVLPKDLSHQDKPYTAEAEFALRNATSHNTTVLKFKGHSGNVFSVNISPDGKRIVSASADSTIRIWDVETGKELHILEGHNAAIFSAAFNPDGKRIVSTSGDNAIRIWDIGTGKVLNTLYCHWVHSAAFSHNGKRIVSASFDGKVRIWDVETGKELNVMEKCSMNQRVSSASFSPDDKCIVLGSDDKNIRIWDTETGRELDTIITHNDFCCEIHLAAFSPDGKRIVSAGFDGKVRIWDVETGKELNTFYTHYGEFVSSVAFSPEGKSIIAESRGIVHIWNLETEKNLIIPTSFYSSIFTPDGRHIISASPDSTVCIWNAESSLLNTLKGHTGGVYSVAFSPYGTRIVSGSADNTVRIWDALTGKELNVLRGFPGVGPTLVFFSGRFVYAHSWYDTREWDVSTGELLDSTPIMMGSCTFFSPNGSRCLSFSGQNVYLQEVEREYELGSKKEEDIVRMKPGRILDTCGEICIEKNFASAAFSPDDKYLVTECYYGICLRNTETGLVLDTINGHTDLVFSVGFSPDGKYIVSASHDKTVRIWDVETRREVSILKHPGAVNYATFSPDGKRIVSASADGIIRIWDFPPFQDLIDQTSEWFEKEGYPLSLDERRMYYLE